MTPQPDTLHTQSTLVTALRLAGLEADMTVLMHSSLKRVGGWICGGAGVFLAALMEVLTPSGTLMMPTFTADNTDPRYWQRPPVPAAWWPTIRAETPPYQADITATRQMGILAETFRRLPGVIRTNHPITSFAAWGRHASLLTRYHPLNACFGEESPLGRLYDLGGVIFLLGVGHGNNTSMHLAEHRSTRPKIMVSEGCAMLVNGQREWVTFTEMDYDDAPFATIGQHYEADHHPVVYGRIGEAATRLLPMRPLVDYTARWLSDHDGREN